MASATEQSDFQSPCKKRKHDASDAEDSNNCSETHFAQYSSSTESQIDACEADSGFTDASNLDAELHPCHIPPRQHKKTSSNCQIMEKLLALRGLIGDQLWHELAFEIFAPPARQKLNHISRFGDVVKLIKSARRIMVLTGAGVSVSCGIPDFRSRNGVYARLAKDFPSLPDPHAMFDSEYFRQDPRPFFKFAKEIYPGSFEPSPSHKFIRSLEMHGKLLRNYTQNIDTLERSAGIRRVIECHGSFAKATCTRCNRIVRAETIREYIFEQKIPVCEICNPGVNYVSSTDPEINFKELVTNGILKPNIVFFGEDLPGKFYKCIRTDRNICDLLLVIGSSLKVRPVAEVPITLPPNVPQILINRERLPHCTFDVELLGDSDVIVNQLCHRLGKSWQSIRWREPLTRAKELCSDNLPNIPPETNVSSECLPNATFADNDYANIKIDKTTLTQLKEYLDPMTRLTSVISSPSSSTSTTSDNSGVNIFEKFGSNLTNGSILPSSDCVDFSDESSFLDFDQSVSFPESANAEYNDNNLTNINATIANLDQSSDNAYHQFGDDCSFLKHTTTHVDSSSDISDTSSFFDNYTSGDLSSPCTSTSVVPQMDERLLASNSLELSVALDGINKNISPYPDTPATSTDDGCDLQSDLEDSFNEPIPPPICMSPEEDSTSKINVSSCLPPNTYYFRPPNKYVFPGAEVQMKKKYLNFSK